VIRRRPSQTSVKQDHQSHPVALLVHSDEQLFEPWLVVVRHEPTGRRRFAQSGGLAAVVGAECPRSRRSPRSRGPTLPPLLQNQGWRCHYTRAPSRAKLPKSLYRVHLHHCLLALPSPAVLGGVGTRSSSGPFAATSPRRMEWLKTLAQYPVIRLRTTEAVKKRRSLLARVRTAPRPCRHAMHPRDPNDLGAGKPSGNDRASAAHVRPSEALGGASRLWAALGARCSRHRFGRCPLLS